ncbi:unnamed protein product [Gulo gulo]|uniref:Uncharacterized protein n=1 Tax=Gulo gulo TaxID=48420 RepID=A0A9X9M3M5_GULGU|nr:unnamed protein product [Gulo gulo]
MSPGWSGPCRRSPPQILVRPTRRLYRSPQTADDLITHWGGGSPRQQAQHAGKPRSGPSLAAAAALAGASDPQPSTSGPLPPRP